MLFAVSVNWDAFFAGALWLLALYIISKMDI